MSLESGPLSGRKHQMENSSLGPDWDALDAACRSGNDARDALRKIELMAVLAMREGSERDRRGRQLAVEWQ